MSAYLIYDVDVHDPAPQRIRQRLNPHPPVRQRVQHYDLALRPNAALEISTGFRRISGPKSPILA